MFISASELTDAMGRISTIAALDKNQPGIMMNIKDTEIDLYYNTQEKAIINTIPAVISEDDYKGKVVFDFNKFNEIISYCKPSGKIGVKDIELVFRKNIKAPGTAFINVAKTMDFSTEGDEVETRVVANNQYELGWWASDELNVKQKILNNPVCANMFDEVNAESWDTEDLCNIFDKVCFGDTKTVYMSPRYCGMFSKTSSSEAVLVKSDREISKIVALNTSFVKALNSVIKSFGSKEVYMNTIDSPDGKLFACIFFDADHKFSVYLCAAKLVNPDLSTMSRYAKIEYNTYQINLITEVFADVIKSAAAINSGSDCTISFETDPTDGGVVAVVSANNTGSSVNNVYRVKCTSFNTLNTLGDGERTWFNITVNAKTLLNVINSNKNNFTGIDIGYENKIPFVRIGSIDTQKAIEAKKVYMENKSKQAAESGAETDIKYTMEDKLLIRNEYIVVSHYIPVKTQ